MYIFSFIVSFNYIEKKIFKCSEKKNFAAQKENISKLLKLIIFKELSVGSSETIFNNQ